MKTTHRTYQQRAYTTKAGYAQIDDVLRECARLYNAALEEWKTAYKQVGVSVSMYSQFRELTMVRSLWGLGYVVEWRILNAADFGEATSRVRFFLQARKDGAQIQWPEPTHSKTGGDDLLGKLPRWRGAKEIIDWSDLAVPCSTTRNTANVR